MKIPRKEQSRWFFGVAGLMKVLGRCCPKKASRNLGHQPNGNTFWTKNLHKPHG